MLDGLLDEVSSTVRTAQNVEQLTRPLLQLLEMVTGLESTYLTRVDEAAGVQSILFARNSKTMTIPEGLSVPWGDTLCKRALDEDRSFTDDVAGCWGDSEAARELGIRTYVTTPVRMADGSLFGTLCAASTEQRPISTEGREALSLFGVLIQQYVERDALVERLQAANRQLEAYSSTDALTGLPNRRSIMLELDRLFVIGRRQGLTVLIAFIDLDGFKQINDSHGHETGDEFLIEVGRRLSRGLRASDLLGRLGGDEFVVFGLGQSVDDHPQDAATALRRRLAPLVEGHYELRRCSLDYAGASFGVVNVNPHETSPAEALTAADAAMYEDKRARRALSGVS